MPALDRAISNTHSPRRSVMIRNDLHFDVTCRLHRFLEEDRWISESLERLRTRRFKGLGQLDLGMHQPDSSAATTCCRFNQYRKTQALCMRASIAESLHRPTAPRNNGNPGLLCQTLGGNLV